MIVAAGGAPILERVAMAAFSSFQLANLYAVSTRCVRLGQQLVSRRIRDRFLRSWTADREWPGFAEKSFNQMWPMLEGQKKDYFP